MFKLKVKPKINIKKLFREKDLEFKSIDSSIKYETALSDDVVMTAEIKADLNYQKADIGLDSVKSAEISFTKKF